MSEGVSESQFYMWRTVFAMAHADHVVTEDERQFMHRILCEERFSAEQRGVLERDMETPQDVSDMFMQIGEQEDRSRFFYFARMMCWSDGNFDEQEQKIMLALKSIHVRNIDFDKVMENVDLEIDEDYRKQITEDMSGSGNPFASFFRRFKSS